MHKHTDQLHQWLRLKEERDAYLVVVDVHQANYSCIPFIELSSSMAEKWFFQCDCRLHCSFIFLWTLLFDAIFETLFWRNWFCAKFLKFELIFKGLNSSNDGPTLMKWKMISFQYFENSIPNILIMTVNWQLLFFHRHPERMSF